MDRKAFTKIYTEAEEAIAEHRFYDTLSLCEAIIKDTSYTEVLEEIAQMREDYGRLLQEMQTLTHEECVEQSNEHFRSVIDLLQMARDFWNQGHPETEYAHISSQLLDMEDDDILDQLHRISKSAVGQEDYHNALDAAFGLLWCVIVNPGAVPMTALALQTSDSFARRTLVGALLLGILERFSPEKLELLLALGKSNPDDDEAEADDLEARVAVALAVIYQRYQTFFTFYTNEAEQLRAFFATKQRKAILPEMLLAFTSQSMVGRIGKRVDDIVPIIRSFLEEQQPHLGNSDDEEEKKTSKDEETGMQIQELFIDKDTNERLFHKLAHHARKVDEMRQADLDVNYSSQEYMKNFDFFNHVAHWFYPFDIQVPIVQQSLTRPNGKLDNMTLTIMSSNRFCASDSYSYVCMMGKLRAKGRSKLSDMLNDQLDELEDAIGEISKEDMTPTLNHVVDFTQGVYRFFYSHTRTKDFLYRPFAPSATPFALLPLFNGLFADADAFKTSIDNAIYLGDNELAIILIDYVADRFGTDGQLLYSRGYALMQLKQWQRALSAFQQLLLIDEHPQAELCMARCFEAQGQWDRALPYLLKEEERCGDDNSAETANIIEETGRCLLQLQRWDEAAQRFFRLEFMERHLNVARRAIGWCSLHQGKYERAANYYRQLIDQKKATWEDRLNMGHALWLQGFTAEAIEAYRQSATAFNRTKKEQRQQFRHWTEAFQEDARGLLATHFDATDCGLMIDAATR